MSHRLEPAKRNRVDRKATAGLRSPGLRAVLWGCAAFLLAQLLAVALFLPAIETCLKAAAVLIECNGAPLPRGLGRVLDKNILVERVSIPSPSGPPVAAILYTPAGRPDAPGMVIAHGLDPGGMESLGGYARLEASTGLRVLTPDLVPLKTYSAGGINMDVVRAIGESARWLAHRTGQPVSVMGISFGGGLSLIAAAGPEYASSIKMVFDAGGYDDLNRVFRFYMTGVDRAPDGRLGHEQPSAWVENFLEYTDLMLRGSPREIAALEPILKARIIDQQHHPRGEAARIAAMTARLSPDERSRLAFLTDRQANREEFAALVDRTPQYQQVSPHGRLAGLTARVYILHGVHDNVIPAEEALWLQHDIGPRRTGGFLLTPLLSHVTFKAVDSRLSDRWAMLHFMYAVHRSALRSTAPGIGGDLDPLWAAAYPVRVLLFCIFAVLLILAAYGMSGLFSGLRVWRSHRL